MKICFISNCPRIGGAERVLLETIDVLLQEGIECRVLLPGAGKFAEELERRGIPHVIIRSAFLTLPGEPTVWRRLKAAARILMATLLVAREIVASKCDVVYSNTVTVGHGAIAAALLNKPHIWHLHEFGREDHGYGYYFGEKFSCQAVGRLSVSCIVVSKALADKYARYIPYTKLAVVYPSMNLELERLSDSGNSGCDGNHRGQLRCITVGGIVEGKRQADAIQAFAHLQKDGINAALTIVGAVESPRYRQELDESIKQHHLEEKVHFAGEVRDARSLIQASDVLLVCSGAEAFGRVTIEAMLAGKPIIGSAAGATPELVRDGCNGLIYPLANSAALADKIRYLYQNPEAGRLLGENGKQWAESLFTNQRFSCELMAVLKSLPERQA